MLTRLLLCCFLVFAYVSNCFAVSFNKKEDLITITAVPEYKTISANTSEINIITAVDIKTGWHLYWDNPGDTGDPTTLTFFESQNYHISSNIHSAPQKSVFDEIITSYIHTNRLYYKTAFKINTLNEISRLPFNLVLSYTACKESCLPGNVSLNFALPVSDREEKNPTYFTMLLEAENTFPVLLHTNADVKDQLLELHIGEQILKDCEEPEFVSNHPKKSVLADLPKTIVTDKEHLQVSFNSDELPPDFKGILLCPGHAYYLDPNQETTLQHPSSKNRADSHLFYYLLTAFLAGLILNLMPCVLPILGLKALYLVQNKQKASIFSGLLYMAGVICSFAVLSGILFYLRQKGEEMGWGFQLQSPTFNLILLFLFFVIFLNLLDKLPLPDRCANSLDKLAGNKSFLTGFFAVIIACPCTGPFMGAALGYAITQPTLIYFSIFGALGLGYALPYTLIEIFPDFFLRFIPKPGHWMLTLKHLLALPILLTCLWLCWVIFNQLKPASSSADIYWEVYSPEKVEQTLNQNEAVFIDFTAKWCLVCLLNDKTTLTTKTFKQTVAKNRIRLFKADWTNRNEKIRDALKTYGRNSIPLYVYYPANKKEPIILPQILTTDIIRTTLEQ